MLGNGLAEIQQITELIRTCRNQLNRLLDLSDVNALLPTALKCIRENLRAGQAIRKKTRGANTQGSFPARDGESPFNVSRFALLIHTNKGCF